MSARAKLTKAQARQLVRALMARHVAELGRPELLELWHAEPGGWIRSLDHGQRVTLASLHYRGLLERRAWDKAGTTSPAHEYRLCDELYQRQQQQALADRHLARVERELAGGVLSG